MEIPLHDVIALEVEAPATVTTTSGAVLLPAYTPRAFYGPSVTITGAVVHLMKNVSSEKGSPIQVFRVDVVQAT